MTPEVRARLEASARRSQERSEFIDRLPMIHDEYRAERSWRAQEAEDLRSCLAEITRLAARVEELEASLAESEAGNRQLQGQLSNMMDIARPVLDAALTHPVTTPGEEPGGWDSWQHEARMDAAPLNEATKQGEG